LQTPPATTTQPNGFQALRNNFANEINGAGNYNTASGSQVLFLNTSGSDNTATGFHALYSNMTGSGNTANGVRALFSNNNNGNTADGYQALFSNTDGFENTANGNEALYSNQTGTGNTATGASALESNTAGNNNIAMGFLAGSDLTTGDNNIYIGNNGVTTESNTIRIGGPAAQNATFIAGIRDTTTGNDDAIPVVIDSAGQLGTASSSARFKREIKPMDRTSEAILALKPVTFHYKSHKSSATGRPQFGLIAEDVAKVNPDLVVRDADGEIYTVRYEAVNAMLLNEFLKQHRKVQEQEKTIAELKSGMQVLAATVKEQAAQIQKVSAHLEVNKPTPQIVLNDQ
jgi:hypothetical protein